jgi:hypothetical protein
MKFFVFSQILFLSVSGLLLSGCANQIPKGSSKTLYTIAETLEITQADLSKDVQLRLDQKLLFNLEPNPEELGTWMLVDYDNRHLLLLNDTPRVASGNWGLLLQARALGSAEVQIRFVPLTENSTPKNYTFPISISR